MHCCTLYIIYILFIAIANLIIKVCTLMFGHDRKLKVREEYYDINRLGSIHEVDRANILEEYNYIDRVM